MKIFKLRSSTFNHSKALLHVLEVMTRVHFSVNPFLILEEVFFQTVLQYIYKVNQFANLIPDNILLNGRFDKDQIL